MQANETTWEQLDNRMVGAAAKFLQTMLSSAAQRAGDRSYADAIGHLGEAKLTIHGCRECLTVELCAPGEDGDDVVLLVLNAVQDVSCLAH